MLSLICTSLQFRCFLLLNYRNTLIRCFCAEYDDKVGANHFDSKTDNKRWYGLACRETVLLALLIRCNAQMVATDSCYYRTI